MKNLNIFSLVAEYDNAKSGVLNVPNVSFVDEDSSVRYLIDIKIEYEYVDLGLPSGLKWATCNVGANSPEEYGLYFAWGEITGYTGDDVKSGVKRFSDESYTAWAISTNLTLEQDAAHVNMGSNWRMPTKVEWEELINNCDASWIDDYNGTGVVGCVFTSNVNGNSIFFPAAGNYRYSSSSDINYWGFYWSASWYSSSWAFHSFLASDGQYVSVNGNRYDGYPVRAVCE